MAPDPSPGDVVEPLLRGAPLDRVEIDVTGARVVLRADGRRVEFRGVAAANVLGPWDGTAGIVDQIRRVASVGDRRCFEICVRFAAIPRVYRVVCSSIEVV